MPVLAGNEERRRELSARLHVDDVRHRARIHAHRRSVVDVLSAVVVRQGQRGLRHDRAARLVRRVARSGRIEVRRPADVLLVDVGRHVGRWRRRELRGVGRAVRRVVPDQIPAG